MMDSPEPIPPYTRRNTVSNLPTNVDIPNQLVDASLVPASLVATDAAVGATVKTAVADTQTAMLAIFSQFDGRAKATGVGATITTAQTAITAASGSGATYGQNLNAWFSGVSAFLTEIASGTGTGSGGDDNYATMQGLLGPITSNVPVGGASANLGTWAEAITAMFVKIAAGDVQYGLNQFTTLAPITVLP
jgi:hypothetical protein